MSNKNTEFVDYIKGCFKRNNGRLYGNFQQRAALNITEFPKIQFSIVIRMGLIYPIISSLISNYGLAETNTLDLFGIEINYHTWVAGYLAYLIEIQLGLSKYPTEFISRIIKLKSAKTN